MPCASAPTATIAPAGPTARVVPEEVTHIAPPAGAAGDVAVPRMKPYRSHRVALRGLDSHVLTWGDAAAPKLFLLHGWMDVAASFQFLVDALAREWYVIAPDLRGYGKSAWQPQGYWYADYIADLEALLEAFAPGETVNLAGHSLGGNVVLHYAGVRPARARRVISLDGFGIRAEESAARPRNSRNGSTRLRIRRTSQPIASFDAVADRLQKNSRRLPRPGDVSRAALGGGAARRRARLSSDPRHKLPFPTVYRIEETYAVWRNITAPRCGLPPRTRTSRNGSTTIPRRRRDRHVRRRQAPLRAHSARPDGDDRRMRATCCITISRRPWRAAMEAFLANDRADRPSVQSERGAYVALALLTLFWGTNWIAMKLALTSAHPILFNIERTWAADRGAFRGAARPRRPLLPESWVAVAVTGFFQTTVNMGSTTMAVADGGAGRAAVLVFTMPFWTVLLAWPVLGERVRGMQWVAIALALVGLTLVVEPWHWEGELSPRPGPSFRVSAGRAGRSR